jgi:hypothetical protein
MGRFEAFVSPPKIAFPDGGDWRWERLGSNAGSVGWKAEHLALLRPFGRQVGETGNTHAVRKPTIDGGFDEISHSAGKSVRRAMPMP